MVYNKFRIRLCGNCCIYCGDISTSDEHFPPECSTTFGFILPCCIECNVLAGTNYAYDFDARCKYVNKCLRKKYNKILQSADWTSDELSSMGRTIKTSILQWQNRKDELKKRIAWNVIAYLANIDQNKYFVQMRAEPNFIIEKEKDLLIRGKRRKTHEGRLRLDYYNK